MSKHRNKEGDIRAFFINLEKLKAKEARCPRCAKWARIIDAHSIQAGKVCPDHQIKRHELVWGKKGIKR